MLCWTATHFFTYFLNETVPFYLHNCYTRSLRHFSIFYKWALPLWPVFIMALCRFLHIFPSHSTWNYTAFFCVNVTQILCKVPPLPLSRLSVELFRSPICDCHTRLYSFLFESFVTHSFFYAVWSGRNPILFHSLGGQFTWLHFGSFSDPFSIV